MHYLSFEAEDFAADDSFYNYCLQTNQDDVVFWEQWCLNHPEKKAVIEDAKRMVLLLSGMGSQEQLVADRLEFQSLAAVHMTKETNTVKKTPLRHLRPFLFKAAAIVVIFAAAAALYVIKNKPEKYRFFETSYTGGKKFFYLPDSTKVTLNAGSAIKIAEDFNGSTREIELNGEAFFVVRHDKDRPFIIHTELMDIKVLGTVFNVKAYSDEMAETALLEGSVEVVMKNKERAPIILKPNEKILLPATSGESRKPSSEPSPDQPEFTLAQLIPDKQDNTLHEVSWTENRLVFNDQEFTDLSRTLARWYNMDIEFRDESVKEYRFTATFEDKSVEQVLTALQLSRNFKYTIIEKKIIIDK